jgi:dihydrodipicolinate synthase/N-acetylneuraminate lyase
MTARAIEGLVPIVATPFDAAGRLDEESLRREVDYLIGAGVDGLTVFGVAGEFYAVSDAERLRGIAIAVEQTRGRVPIIAGTGHTGTEVAIELSQAAEKAGAAAVMLIMPYFLRPDGEGAFQYCRRVGEAIGIPIMVQDQPLTTGVALPVPLLTRMHREIPAVTLAKIETPAPAPKIAALTKAAGPGLVVLGGMAGVFLLEELAAGARGTMPAALMPEVYGAVWRAYWAGDRAAARRTYHRYLPLIRVTNQPGLGPRLVKEILRLAGVIETSYTRGPAPELDELTRDALGETVEELGIVEIMRGRAPVRTD